jgi:hypothetical protein
MSDEFKFCTSCQSMRKLALGGWQTGKVKRWRCADCYALMSRSQPKAKKQLRDLPILTPLGESYEY